MKINLPKEVKKIFEVLNTAGYETYIVGGCVRDSLLGLEPKDWDITTNALPDVVLQLFQEKHLVLPTGIDYGTVTVYMNDDKYEITTFRSDGEYVDGRRPSNVSFVGTLESDVRRRDLTINALAYNDKVGLVDYVGGYRDLLNRQIKFVGNVQDRLNEDTLRSLRAFRFWCRFDYDMDETTYKCCYMHFVKNFRVLAQERITMEIMNIFSCKNLSVEKLDTIVRLLGDTVIPEIKLMIGCTQNNAHHKYTVYEHTLYVMSNCSKSGDTRLMFAALLHDIGKPSVKTLGKDGYEHFVGHADVSTDLSKQILTRLKVTNQFMTDVLFLVKNHDNFNQGVRVKSLRKFMSGVTKVQLDRWKVLRKADILSQVYTVEKENNYKQVIVLMRQIDEDRTDFRLSDIQINGNDILDMGILDKRQIKVILNDCLVNCWGNPKCNNRDWLLQYASKLVKKSNNAYKNQG